LASVAGITFAATLGGTFWLVWLGLLPLRRLSDAVSRVFSAGFSSADRRRAIAAQ
jgi:hypothetical protein